MEAAKIYFIIFGLLTIVGGIIGYVKGWQRGVDHCRGNHRGFAARSGISFA